MIDIDLLLHDVRFYLRIDNHYEDDLIKSLIAAACDFVQSATGIEVTKDNAKAVLVVKLLVAYWYENRSVIGQAESLPYALTALLIQIETDALKARAGNEKNQN